MIKIQQGDFDNKNNIISKNRFILKTIFGGLQ